ncbi:MAG: NAD-dependent epimerase/dehydratase family protein [Lachnospiraceae bacterium]|nr:NAD-dependent epimerase/dehydratase family protein [Lachnospiraceae bacterium]
MNRYQQEIRGMIDLPLPWEKLIGKTIMLSGATGMIGKCMIDVLMHYNETWAQQGSEIRVIALSRNEAKARERFDKYWEEKCFTYMSCDVNEMIPDCGHVDYIVHAASNTHPLQYSQDSIGTINSNIIGTKNLLDYAVAHKAEQFCFVSSVEVYGENRGDVEKFDEKYLGYIDCNTLRAGYPESKRLGETLCNAYKQTYGLDFVIPRLSRCYGPTMLSSDTKAISQFIKKAAAGEDIVLKSEGTQKYSYSFVTDAVAGILYAVLLGESGEAYNIADKESDITLKDLAETLADIAGTKVIFDLPDEAERRGYSTATKAMLDASKLEALGWKAQVHMAEGLRCVVESIR